GCGAHGVDDQGGGAARFGHEAVTRRPPRAVIRAASVACGLAILAWLSCLGTPASAKILKTRIPGQEQTGTLPLNVGSGFEYETDGEESEYGFPFLIEYGFTRELKLSLEPSYVLVRKKRGLGTVSGAGDFETTLSCEFPIERRYRPGFALESVIKWPTAQRGDLGTGETDYSIGAIVSKEFVPFDVDLNGVYTFIGPARRAPRGHVRSIDRHRMALERQTRPRGRMGLELRRRW